LARPAPVVDVESPEERFLARLRETLEANLADEDFDVRALARAVGESRSNLYRRVDELVGETPSQLIKSVRLERAEAMLRAGAGSIQQVAYAVGFKSVSHFSRSFREKFGVSPSRLEDRASR
ncbi:MAG: AraC family transcriptional regulator, partial [Gemmatimonadota bacterium]